MLNKKRKFIWIAKKHTNKKFLWKKQNMDNQNCKNCLFFGKDIVDGYEVRVCRRYAPRYVSGVGTGETSQKFPIVSPDDWCGEWKRTWKDNSDESDKP